MLSELPIDIIICVVEYLEDVDLYKFLRVNKNITHEIVNTCERLKSKCERIDKQIRVLYHINEYIGYIKEFQWDFLKNLDTFSTFTIDNYPTKSIMPLKEVILVFDCIDKILENVYIPVGREILTVCSSTKSNKSVTLYGTFVVNGVLNASITRKIDERLIGLRDIYELYSPRITGSCYVFVTQQSYDDIVEFKRTLEDTNVMKDDLGYTKYYIPFGVEEITFMVKYYNKDKPIKKLHDIIV